MVPNKIILNEGNKHVQKLKAYLKFDKNRNYPNGKWINCQTYLYKYLFQNIDKIIENNKININEIITNDGDREKLIKYNNIRLLDKTLVKPEDAKIIIKFLQDYLTEQISPTVKAEDSRSFKYIDAIEFNNDYTNNIHLSTETDIIFPSELSTYDSVLQNLFYNNDVMYAFTEAITEAEAVSEATEVCTGTFIISGSGDDVEIPTKFRHVCRSKTQYGVECGNIVEFYKGHTNNTIKCNLSNNAKEGHTITNVDNITPFKLKHLWAYNGYFVGDEDKKEITIYSLQQLNKEKIRTNFLYIADKSPFILILGYKTTSDEKTYDKQIVFKDKNSASIIDDLYKSLIKYFDEEHDLYINSSNKIVAHYIILQNLTKLLFDHKYNMFIVGASGMGKSFLGNMLVPMFTFNYKKLLGSNVTPNRFLGGRSNVISSFRNSVYEPGYVETKDILIVDEATEPLDERINPKVPTNSNNLYYMIKAVAEGMNRGIQGSRDIKPNASLLLFGNLSHLTYMKNEYISKVRKKFTSYSNGQTFNYKLPLYKPVPYYSGSSIQSKALAKAHALIRDQHYSSIHYITGLPEAEQSRFTVFIALENEFNGFETIAFTGNEEISTFHREKFIQDIHDELGDIKEPPVSFVRQVWDFMNEYVANEATNFRYNRMSRVNRHLFKGNSTMMADFLWINKHWMGLNNTKDCRAEEDPTTLTEQDKTLVRYYLKFNYNTLDSKEAEMREHPQINNMAFEVDEIYENDNAMREQYKVNLTRQAINKEKGQIELNDEETAILESAGNFGVPPGEFE